MIPPKPSARKDNVSLLAHFRAFRRDILSAQPAKLYRAWMAEFKTPFFRSFLINQPELISEVLKNRQKDFPKSERIGQGLRPLLGESVFLTNGDMWEFQRRIIDPAFEGGRVKTVFPAMTACVRDAVDRLGRADGVVDIEREASHLTADIIFRTLFSIPITHETAAAVYSRFRAYQKAQPIASIGAFVPQLGNLPFTKRRARQHASHIRQLISGLCEERAEAIKTGSAPDDLATKIMTTKDPETGRTFSSDEMVDQVAIFFLAGHETSAAALSWALYLVASSEDWQERIAKEAKSLPKEPAIGDLAALKDTRAAFREALRLYPPVPMMVRQASCPEVFRDRTVPKGAQIVISPWHLHRHERLWDRPDEFDPDRFSTENGKACLRNAYIPFSAGPRVCPGAGFAMTEGVLALAQMCRDLRFTAQKEHVPIPEAQLTVRSRNSIFLSVERR